MLKLIVIKAKEGKKEELESILRMLAVYSKAEEGCNRYELYDSDDGFVILEEWSSEGRLAAHRKSPHFADFEETGEQLIETKLSKIITRI